MIRQRQEGEDFVFEAFDRVYAGKVSEALRLDGLTGKVTAQAGFASGQLLHEDWDKEAADGAAATATAEHALLRASQALVVKSVEFIPDATLTANDATYASIVVQRRNADGSGAVTVASVSTKTSASGGSGNWAAFAAVSLALTAANLVLAAGQVLTVEITKASTGVVVPAGKLVVDYLAA